MWNAPRKELKKKKNDNGKWISTKPTNIKQTNAKRITTHVVKEENEMFCSFNVNSKIITPVYSTSQQQFL